MDPAPFGEGGREEGLKWIVIRGVEGGVSFFFVPPAGDPLGEALCSFGICARATSARQIREISRLANDELQTSPTAVV